MLLNTEARVPQSKRQHISQEAVERGKKHLSALKLVLEADDSIDEVGFIVQPEGEESHIFSVDHKLAISFACSFDLYLAASARVSELKAALHNYKSLTEPTQKRLLSELKLCSSAVLFLNADNYTVWNIRKRLVQIKAIVSKEELAFVTIVLTKHPKSSETWAHRTWVLPLAIKQEQQQETLASILRGEFEICRRSSELHPKNYYSWTYRIQIADNCARFVPHLLLEELEHISSWNSLHVTDHAGFHHRQHVTRLLASSSSLPSETTETTKLNEGSPLASWGGWAQEFNFVSELILRYRGHETLWVHRRFVFYAWLAGNAPKSAEESKIPPSVTNDTWTSAIDTLVAQIGYSKQTKISAANELMFCHLTCCDSRQNADGDNSLELQRMFASRYVAWMIFETKHIHGFWESVERTGTFRDFILAVCPQNQTQENFDFVSSQKCLHLLLEWFSQVKLQSA